MLRAHIPRALERMRIVPAPARRPRLDLPADEPRPAVELRIERPRQNLLDPLPVDPGALRRDLLLDDQVRRRRRRLADAPEGPALALGEPRVARGPVLEAAERLRVVVPAVERLQRQDDVVRPGGDELQHLHRAAGRPGGIRAIDRTRGPAAHPDRRVVADRPRRVRRVARAVLRPAELHLERLAVMHLGRRVGPAPGAARDRRRHRPVGDVVVDRRHGHVRRARPGIVRPRHRVGHRRRLVGVVAVLARAQRHLLGHVPVVTREDDPHRHRAHVRRPRNRRAHRHVPRRALRQHQRVGRRAALLDVKRGDVREHRRILGDRHRRRRGLAGVRRHRRRVQHRRREGHRLVRVVRAVQRRGEVHRPRHPGAVAGRDRLRPEFAVERVVRRIVRRAAHGQLDLHLEVRDAVRGPGARRHDPGRQRHLARLALGHLRRRRRHRDPPRVARLDVRPGRHLAVDVARADDIRHHRLQGEGLRVLRQGVVLDGHRAPALRHPAPLPVHRALGEVPAPEGHRLVHRHVVVRRRRRAVRRHHLHAEREVRRRAHVLLRRRRQRPLDPPALGRRRAHREVHPAERLDRLAQPDLRQDAVAHLVLRLHPVGPLVADHQAGVGVGRGRAHRVPRRGAPVRLHAAVRRAHLHHIVGNRPAAGVRRRLPGHVDGVLGRPGPGRDVPRRPRRLRRDGGAVRHRDRLVRPQREVRRVVARVVVLDRPRVVSRRRIAVGEREDLALPDLRRDLALGLVRERERHHRPVDVDRRDPQHRPVRGGEREAVERGPVGRRPVERLVEGDRYGVAGRIDRHRHRRRRDDVRAGGAHDIGGRARAGVVDRPDPVVARGLRGQPGVRVGPGRGAEIRRERRPRVAAVRRPLDPVAGDRRGALVRGRGPGQRDGRVGGPEGGRDGRRRQPGGHRRGPVGGGGARHFDGEPAIGAPATGSFTADTR